MTTTIGPVAPSNPQPLDIWHSTALAYARFPSHPGETYVAVDAGATPSQEPNSWYYNGLIYLLLNQSAALVLYTAPAPVGGRPQDVVFTKVGTVMGGGVGGEASGVVHPSKFIDGPWNTDSTMVYIDYITAGNGLIVKRAGATMAAIAASPTTAFAGSQAVLIQKAGGVLPDALQLGNYGGVNLSPIGGNYGLLVEALWGTGSDSWNPVFATCATATGTHSVETGILKSMDAQPGHQRSKQNPIPPTTNFLLEGWRGWMGAGSPIWENGQFVMITHGWKTGSGDGNPTSDLYRLTSPNCRNWTVDLWGYPIYARQDTRYEHDQVADADPCWVPGGWWCFWTAASNPSNTFVVKWAPLSATTLMRDGMVWSPMDQSRPQIGSQSLVPEARYAISGQPVKPFGDYLIDPSNTAGFVFPLPRGAHGTLIGAANGGTGTGTVQATCTAPATFASSGTQSDATTLARGQAVVFKCLKESAAVETWVRLG
jgi:hypothetical protein